MTYTNIEQLDEKKKRKALYNKEYRLKNLEKAREYDKKYFLKNKDKIKSRKSKNYSENKDSIKIAKKLYYAEKSEIIKEKAKKYYHLNPELSKERHRRYGQSIKGKFVTYKTSAKNRKIDFNLSIEDFESIFTQDCHYCGKQQARGIDRKYSDKSYTTENCLPCCSTCNYMKRDVSYEDFINHIRTIYLNKY